MTAPALPPAHIAIIMDGNGRWARRRGLPRVAGHRRGVDRIHPVALACAQRGIRYLTLYAFSTENWRRPGAEVSALLRLLESMIDEEAKTCLRDNIRLRLIGTLERLNESLRTKVHAAIEMNRHNTGLTLVLAFDYGSRDEMVRAARALVAGGAQRDEIDESAVAAHLYTADMPDVDLLIRCGGELRLSNFLMWQAAYAELYFTEELWPEFGEQELDRALAAFGARNRRFGGLTRGDGS